MDRDPVCGRYVDPERSSWVAEHAGKDHYFCSEACQRAFASDPEKFLSDGTGGQAHGGLLRRREGKRLEGIH